MTGRDEDARLPHIDGRTRAASIAALNDALRRYRISGRLAITAGVIALGDRALPAILEQVAAYDSFGGDNDPHGEHDFGAFEHDGSYIIWKVDAYARAMRYASPDPANPAVTIRVLTVMLAEEY